MQLDTSTTVPLARSRQTATDTTPRESGGSADVHSITADGVLAQSNRSRLQLVGDGELAPALPSLLPVPALPIAGGLRSGGRHHVHSALAAFGLNA